jgi:hypothetical protein
MSVKKKEEMNQRLHILSKFTDPVELTPEQRRQFYVSVGLNVLLLVALFCMAIQLVMDHLFGGDSQNDHEKKNSNETSTEGAANQHDKKED